jgi:hypothetical protein
MMILRTVTLIVIGLVFSNAHAANSFVEIVEHDPDSYLLVEEMPQVEKVDIISDSIYEEHQEGSVYGDPTFELQQGLIKTNIERLTYELQPSHSVVWNADQRLEQYSTLVLTGKSYEAILEQIAMQYQIGACIRPNNVVEIYDIKANRFYCED